MKLHKILPQFCRSCSRLGGRKLKLVDFAFVRMKVTQLCLTLCDPMDYTVHRILQARILEWIAVPFSRGFSHTQVSCIAGSFFTS